MKKKKSWGHVKEIYIYIYFFIIKKALGLLHYFSMHWVACSNSLALVKYRTFAVSVFFVVFFSFFPKHGKKKCYIGHICCYCSKMLTIVPLMYPENAYIIYKHK
jgi:hypothetical protein